jgi:hypothetical protein
VAPGSRHRHGVRDGATSGESWRRLLFPTRVALGVAIAVCVLAPAVLVAMQINTHPAFSPIDEAVHFDYVERVASGELPRQGQLLLPSTLREYACRGLALGPELPPCGSQTLEHRQFPQGGFQYEAQQPPFYYALTVPLRWVAQHVLGVGDEVDATRATNIAWLIAGLLLLWAAGRIMAIDPLALGAGLLLLAAAPTVVYGAGTVSNDATAIPAAGLVALVAALVHRSQGPRAPIALLGAGAVAAGGKATNLLAVVAVSALFAVAAIANHASAERWTTTVRRWSRTGGALLLGGALSAGAWALVHRSLSLIDLRDEPSFSVLRGTPRTLGLVMRRAGEVLDPLTNSFVSPDTLGRNLQVPWHATLPLLLGAGSLTGLFVSPRRWSHYLGLITVPVLYLGGVALGLALVISYDIDPGLSGRYGLSVAPLMVLVLADSLTGAWPKRAVGAFAVTLLIATVAVMVA